MGARLGRYEVLKHLASGGMADVLLGRADGIQGFERHVVLKRIKPVHAQDQRFIRMFLDEARVAANLHHQHIVQVHDIGEAGGEYFIAMEYLHGEDVRTILGAASKARQHVPLGYAIAIVSAAAAGLHYAHERRGPDKRSLGIVHRDVSPSNILVGYDGSIKLVDFGIAKASARQETRSGSLKGKVSYMSPEQCKSGEVDRRSDVYSLGVVLYELATTTRLFKGDSDYLVMDQIVNGRVPLPRSRRPDLPSELSAIIMRAIAPDPERRFATADELRLALDQFAGKLGLTASTSSVAAYMRKQFGEKPEPWQELSGLLAVPRSSAQQGVPGLGGWTELWRSDGPARGSASSIPPPAAAHGSGGFARPSRALGTDAGSGAADTDPSARRIVARPPTAPSDSRPATGGQRPAPVGGRVSALKVAMVTGPVIALLGAGTWWLAEAIEAQDAAASAPVPAPKAIVAAPPAMPAVVAPPANAAVAPANAAIVARATPRTGSSENSVEAAKRSRKANAPKSIEPAAPPAAAPPAPAVPASAPGSTVPITTLPVPAPASVSPPSQPAVAPPSAAPAAPAAPVSTASPAADAPSQLSHAMLDRVAADHTRELSRCDGGEELHGEVTVRFLVDAEGRVRKAQVATTLGKPKVAACILRSVQKWQFPAQPASGAQGTYTLSFQ